MTTSYWVDPVEVSAAVVPLNAAHCWAVVSDENVLGAGAHEDRNEAWMQILAILLTHPNLAGKPINFYTTDRALRRTVAENQAELMPSVEAIPAGGVHPQSADLVLAHEAATAHAPDLPVLHAATDGAKDTSKRNTRNGGWAWVTAEGHCNYGDVNVRSVLAAELIAIRELLDFTGKDPKLAGRPLRVQVDNLKAIKLATLALTGQSDEAHAANQPKPSVQQLMRVASQHQLNQGRNTRAEVDKVIDQIARHAGRDVELTKVKAHSGETLNEAADSLAVRAKRSAMWGTAGDDVAANNIMKKVAEELSA